MSLKPREQRTLAEIENQLRRTDPELVVMFTRLARGDQRMASLMGRHPLSRPQRGSRARTVILITLGTILLIACVAMAVATAGRAVPRRGSYLPAAGRAAAHSATYPPGAHSSAG